MHDRDLTGRSTETYKAQLYPEAQSLAKGNAPGARVCFTFGFFENLGFTSKVIWRR